VSLLSRQFRDEVKVARLDSENRALPVLAQERQPGRLSGRFATLADICPLRSRYVNGRGRVRRHGNLPNEGIALNLPVTGDTTANGIVMALAQVTPAPSSGFMVICL